jgi:hypothetical protein
MILIVTTYVYFGAVVSMQEFTSKETCEAAAREVVRQTQDVNRNGMARTQCVPK